MGGMKELLGDEPVVFGTEPHKLHRRDSSSTSVAAAHTVKTGKLEQIVLAAIVRHGEHGCIQSGVLAEFPHKPYSSITARFASLKEKGLITRGPDSRRGASGSQQEVMRATELGRRLVLT